MKSLYAIVLLFAFSTTQSQTATDTLPAVKSVQELEMQSKISTRQQSLDKKKLELGELQAKLADKNVATSNATQKSNESSDKNVDAAVDMQKNSTHKNSRQARKAAKRAQRDASDQRSSESDVKSLKKSINKKEKEIAKDERELADLKSKSLVQSVKPTSGS